MSSVLALFVVGSSGYGPVFGPAFPGPPPPPPAAIVFDGTLDNYTVLQSTSGGDAYVYGMSTSDSITVKVTGRGCTGQSVVADMTNAPPGQASAFKAKVPGKAGGDCTVTASDGKGNIAVLNHVTYGDVWYCGGQSNMALPLANTFQRFETQAAIKAGKYSNIRIKQMSTNMNPAVPWSTLASAADKIVTAGGWGGANTSELFHFSASCYYFGQSLTDELGPDAPPIGLIHTAWGGSMIEQWLPAETVDSCQMSCSNVTTCGVGEWWEQRITPYANMTIKGWAWYQGENNMHNLFGNSASGTGYGCLMPKLVSQWRKIWAANSGTDPNAPFGLVTLAASGSEGGADIGSMRYAQTGSYGMLPNEVMPNTFLAQAYDLDDPVGSLGCYHDGCCTTPFNHSKPGCQTGCEKICADWGALPCSDNQCAPVYMGPIHPRDKIHVGRRLARAAATTVYGKPGASTGPTLTGCKKRGSKLTLTFNSSLFGGDTFEVQPYNRSVVGASQMAVLVNQSNFCFQIGKFGEGEATAGGDRLPGGSTVGAVGGSPSAWQPCADDGFGKSGGMVDEAADWVAVDVAAGSGPNSVVVDLTRSKGVAFGIRYGWLNGGSCCGTLLEGGQYCPVAQCPLMLKTSQLPANPFMAKITADGKCECMPPQKCDE